MLESYVPILILLGVTLANAVGMVVLSHVVSPFRPTPAKGSRTNRA
jgi:NADH:ubiquinone oxidoreductase subunit 3 (subunit A)